MDQVPSRGWSMRHGHLQFLVDCCGRNNFSKSVAWQKQGSSEEAQIHCFNTKPSKTKDTRKRKAGKVRHESVVCDWVEDFGVLSEDVIMPPIRLALAPRSLAEESDFLQRALQESEQEANLQRAIQESEEEANLQAAMRESFRESQSQTSSAVPNSLQLQTLRPAVLGLLRQRSAPCIALEVADAETRMDRVYVPLTAWHAAPRVLHKRSAIPWEEAVEKATSNAERYKFQPVRTEPSQTKSAPPLALSAESLQTYPTVPVYGRPPAAAEHSRVLADRKSVV